MGGVLPHVKKLKRPTRGASVCYLLCYYPLFVLSRACWPVCRYALQCSASVGRPSAQWQTATTVSRKTELFTWIATGSQQSRRPERQGEISTPVILWPQRLEDKERTAAAVYGSLFRSFARLLLSSLRLNDL